MRTAIRGLTACVTGGAALVLLTACGGGTTKDAAATSSSSTTPAATAAPVTAPSVTAQPVASGNPLPQSKLPGSYFSATKLAVYTQQVQSRWDTTGMGGPKYFPDASMTMQIGMSICSLMKDNRASEADQPMEAAYGGLDGALFSIEATLVLCPELAKG